MENIFPDPSQRKAARFAGLAYIIIIFAGIFAEVFVRSGMIVAGDAAATASNIMASESFFRIGIVSDVVMLIADVIVALALYVLLRPINRNLALLAAFFRLVQASVLGVNLLNLYAVLQFLGGADYLAVFDAEQSSALAMSFLEAHAMGYDIGLIFFAFGTAILGYLLFKSGYVPKVIAIALPLASVVYLVGSFAHILAPDIAGMVEPAYLLPFVAESALALWLLVKGANIQIKDSNTLIASPA